MAEVLEITEKLAKQATFTTEEVNALIVKEMARIETEEEKKVIASRVQSALKVVGNKGKLNPTDFDYLIDNCKIFHFENRQFYVKKEAIMYSARFDGLVCELIRRDGKNESLSCPLRQLIVKGSAEKWLESKSFEIMEDDGKEFKKELGAKIREMASRRAKRNELDKLSEKLVESKIETRIYKSAIKIKMELIESAK
jgi:hypothetical protein